VSEPATLDPAFATRAGEQAIVRLLLPDLTVFDDRGQVVSRLAAALPEVKTSSAGRTARWTLRAGLHWSDGEPVESSDVVFGHAIESDAELDAVNLSVARQVAAIEVEGPRRFIVRWRTRYRGVADPRVHAVLPAHAYPKTRGPGFRGLGRDVVSSGPFRLVGWRPGQDLTLEPNPHWPGPEPGLDRIVFRFFPSEDAFETELRAGGIDALGPSSGLSLDAAQRLADELEATHVLEARTSGLLLHLGLRHDHPLLADPRAREALDLAIDRARMAELVYGGLATPAAGIYAPIHPAHADRRAPPHNPERARALLAATRAQPEPLTLSFASGSAASERAATYLEAAFEAVGLEIDLRARPLRVLFGRMEAGAHAPLVLFAWRTRPDWAGAAMLGSEGRLNFGGYESADMDALLARAEATADRSTWVEVLEAVEARVLADRPFIPLLFRQEVSLRPRRLEGWRPTGTTTPVTWNAEAWRWRD
jgi:peptide/nickel transport system substrate-binding protein